MWSHGSLHDDVQVGSTSLIDFIESCDVLRPYVAHIDDIFKDFTSYKVRVPVTGAIILDETFERLYTCLRSDVAACLSKNLLSSILSYILSSIKYEVKIRNIKALYDDGNAGFELLNLLRAWKELHPVAMGKKQSPLRPSSSGKRLGGFVGVSQCLLVKGWKGTSWSFPRGKKNKDEEDHTCAIREVQEETGFDVSKLLNQDEYIEEIFGQQRVRLYIIAGVKDDTAFAPLTKKEISEISWHRLDDLQPVSGDVISRGLSGVKLYMVAPFLLSLKSWISAHQPPIAPKFDAPAKGFCVWKAKNSSTGSSTMIAENQATKPVSDVHPPDTGPGRSFRNFRFDTTAILKAMDSAFSA
ncbi:mRNA-decapping enzyme subunit 2 [Vitis vinifera]|uniref:mRNA-decapping enzyme subunit 2 n=1 Tax=Vitis vinifera TaxID=29760 RepID=A0A438HIP7_VITVI|nr:mRNA-decapping enzyme subunit 2 [Vitis vinifera]